MSSLVCVTVVDQAGHSYILNAHGFGLGSIFVYDFEERFCNAGIYILRVPQLVVR